jgi:hypothetical protein
MRIRVVGPASLAAVVTALVLLLSGCPGGGAGSDGTGGGYSMPG